MHGRLGLLAAAHQTQIFFVYYVCLLVFAHALAMIVIADSVEAAMHALSDIRFAASMRACKAVEMKTWRSFQANYIEHDLNQGQTAWQGGW